jgi:hypothetical protein
MTDSAIQSADLSRFDQLVKRHELKDDVATQLKTVLSMCEVVLLCDDSGSMNTKIVEPGANANKIPMTRWMELKKLASVVIEFVTAINEKGLDLYFLNRPKLTNVTSVAGLQNTFSQIPAGATPLSAALNQIYWDKINIVSNTRQLLIVVITDGQPTDGSYDGSPTEYSRELLYDTLSRITYGRNIHVSFAECTDNPENMEYLDAWDGRIINFDNTDDYREELARVKRVQGNAFKFDYTDYVIKILLATFIRWYFNLDRGIATNQVNYVQNAAISQDACCIIL